MAAFITRPMSFSDVAPVSSMARVDGRRNLLRRGGSRQVALEHQYLR